MIQTTSPPAASRKWLRISGGRIRLPASCCWRIPPRISQIESSTKPPPAVITQAINAAHFITPPFFASASERLAQRRLYTATMYLSSIRVGASPPVAEREQDAAVSIVAVAIGCIAADFVDGGACECSCKQRRPHAPVELGEPRPRTNERAQRAGRGRNHRALAGHLRDGCLVAEPTERGADTSERCSETLRRTKPRLASEFSTERDTDLAQTVAAPACGQGIDDEADQLLVAALRKFDRRHLWSDTVGLGRPPCARARASRPPLERGNQKTRFRQPLEPTTGNVAVNPLRGGDLVGCHRQRLRTGEAERLAQLAITDRIKPMHHF